jgi:actin-related protein 5
MASCPSTRIMSLTHPHHSRRTASSCPSTLHRRPSFLCSEEKAFSAAASGQSNPFAVVSFMTRKFRIPWGASQASDYLLKLIQLKYPSFPSRVTAPQTNVILPISLNPSIYTHNAYQWLLRTQCSFSPSYSALLKSLKTPANLLADTTIIQFPYALPVTEEKTEEELARIAERRREQGKRLQQMAAEMRAKRKAEKELKGDARQKDGDLQFLLNLREEKNDVASEREWLVRRLH